MGWKLIGLFKKFWHNLRVYSYLFKTIIGIEQLLDLDETLEKVFSWED